MLGAGARRPARAPHSPALLAAGPQVLERMLALRRQYPAWGKETLAAVYFAW